MPTHALTSQSSLTLSGASGRPVAISNAGPGSVTVTWRDASTEHTDTIASAGSTTITPYDGKLIMATTTTASVTVEADSSPSGMVIGDGDNVSLGAKADAAATTDMGTFSLIALFKRLLQKVTAGILLAAGEAHVGEVAGYGFDATTAVVPTTTAGAYAAGDIVGGLMTFAIGRIAAGMVILQDVEISIKSNVAPSLTLVIFTDDPTSTTKTNDSPYTLNVADAFKVRVALPLNALGAINTTHGPSGIRSIHLGNQAIPIRLSSGSVNVYALLIDNTGVTLGTTSDIQVRLAGVEA